jgi:hypothetical protein
MPPLPEASSGQALKKDKPPPPRVARVLLLDKEEKWLNSLRFSVNSKRDFTAANSPPFEEPVRPRRKKYSRFTGREVVGSLLGWLASMCLIKAFVHSWLVFEWYFAESFVG